MGVTWLGKDELFPEVARRFEEVELLLDIGSGIKPQTQIKARTQICCEPFPQYAQILIDKIETEFRPHGKSYVVLQATWEEAMRILPDKSVDTITLLDVIEHLEKEPARELLRQAENKARRQIVLFTPLGFMPQYHPDGKDAWQLDGGSWQDHRSGWEPSDFDDTWDHYAAREFHLEDNMGRSLDEPFGAFFAIKTFPYESRRPIGRREKIHGALDRCLDVLKR